MDEDIVHFNLIGEDINRINEWSLTNKRDKYLRRILNDIYMKMYRDLMRDGLNVVQINNPLHAKITNYSRQSKSKKNKHNSASIRKHKRKLQRTIRLRTLEEYPEN